MAEAIGQAGTKREHFLEKRWDGAGTYTCECGASIEAVNSDVLMWLFLDHCVDQTTRQARAEVLAAVPKPLGRPLMIDQDFYRLTELNYLLELFHRKEPAAKDLEELLREAEVKGLRFALCAAHDEQVDEIIEEVINRRIAELEKARAILEKKS